MSDEIATLAVLVQGLRDQQTLEQLLQRIADGAAVLTGAPRASVRLLDASRTRLMSVVRAGDPLHTNALKDFTLGEGLVGWVALHGQPLRLADAERDPRFKRRGDLIAPMGSFLAVPLMAGRACLGVLSVINSTPDAFTEHHLSLLSLLGAVTAPHVEIARLARLSQVDPLTGALNRRGLELAFPDQHAGPTTVVLVDVDHFKLVNDQHGHAVGDEVLRRVAHLLSSAVRGGDAVVRLGGEEFLLVLPGIELSRARRIAERARAAVEASPLVIGDETVAVTASFGVAEQRAEETRDAVIGRADRAMYEAKKTGRNRVVQA